jgi:transcriptional regulator with XRE-family HTH domain
LHSFQPSHIPDAMLTEAQSRAARGLLNWSRDDLAKASGVPKPTLRGFELGADSRSSTLRRLRRALEEAGVEFLDGAEGSGVRLKPWAEAKLKASAEQRMQSLQESRRTKRANPPSRKQRKSASS